MAIDDLRLVAMHNVVKGGFEYYHRRVCRWYSEKFATPLEDVYELPVDDVFLHYFEVYYESLNEPERKIEIEEILKTPEQKAKEEKDKILQEMSNEDFFKKIQQQESQKTKQESLTQEAVQKMEQMVAKMRNLTQQAEQAKTESDQSKFSIPREIPINIPDDLPDEEPDAAFGIKLKPRKPPKR